jgi:hypothetical protein
MAVAKKKKWSEYMWIVSVTYLTLGFFNIMFAWFGLLCFFIPLIMSIVQGKKSYCNKFCGRGQLFTVLGKKLKLFRNKDVPKWMKTRVFRYSFLAFFLTMFCLMIRNTYLVFAGTQSLREAVTLLWAFQLPWHFAYHGTAFSPWTAQFAFGFYGVMLTSSVLGMITMVIYKPRSWCVYCPMGTMTQLICMAKHPATAKNPNGVKVVENILQNKEVQFTKKISTNKGIR